VESTATADSFDYSGTIEVIGFSVISTNMALNRNNPVELGPAQSFIVNVITLFVHG